MPDETTMTKPPHRKRRWFRFSLRTMLLATTVLCVLLGWKINAAHEQRQAVIGFQELGGSVWYDYQIGPDIFKQIIPRPEPVWYAKLLGADYFYDVVEISISGSPAKDRAVLPFVRHFPRLRSVLIENAKLNDIDFQYLANLKDMQCLWLTNNGATGMGFKYLADLRKLKVLSVRSNPIVDSPPLQRQNQFGLYCTVPSRGTNGPGQCCQ